MGGSVHGAALYFFFLPTPIKKTETQFFRSPSRFEPLREFAQNSVAARFRGRFLVQKVAMLRLGFAVQRPVNRRPGARCRAVSGESERFRNRLKPVSKWLRLERFQSSTQAMQSSNLTWTVGVIIGIAPSPVLPLSITSIYRSGSEVGFDWIGGKATYQLEASDSLNGGDWTSLGSPQTQYAAAIPICNKLQRFFRIKGQP